MRIWLAGREKKNYLHEWGLWWRVSWTAGPCVDEILFKMKNKAAFALVLAINKQNIRLHAPTTTHTLGVLTAGAPRQSGERGWTATPRGDPGRLFLHKGFEGVFMSHIWRIPVDQSHSVFAPVNPPAPTLLPPTLPLHPYFILTVGTERHWWKLAN